MAEGLFGNVLTNLISQLGPRGVQGEDDEEYGPRLRGRQAMPGRAGVPGSPMGDAQHPAFSSSTPPLAHSDHGATQTGSVKAGDYGQTVNASNQVKPADAQPAVAANTPPTPLPTTSPSAAPPSASAPPVTPAPGAIQTPKYTPVDFQQRMALAQKRDALALPNDPNSKELRPGFGRKLGAALLGFAGGFGGDKNAGDLVQNVLRAKFNRAETQRQSRLGVAEKDVSDFDKQSQERRSDFESQSAASKGEIDAQKAQTESRRESREEETAANSPEGRPYYSKDGQLVQKTKGGKEVPFTPKSIEEGAAAEVAAGKPGQFSAMWKAEKKNQPATPRAQGETEYRDAVQQFRKENKREPTLVERQRIHKGLDPLTGKSVETDKPDKTRGTPEQFKGTDKEHDKAYVDAKKELDRRKAGRDDKGKMVDFRPRKVREQEANDWYKQRTQEIEDTYHKSIRDLGGSTDEVNASQPSPSRESAAPAGPENNAKDKPQPTEVEAAKRRVPEGRVLVWKDGKYGHVPKAQSESAKKQGYEIYQ